MHWFMFALLSTAVLAAAAGLLSTLEPGGSRFVSASKYDGWTGVTLFFVLLAINTAFFAWWQPVFHAGGWVFWALFVLVLVGLIAWGYDTLEGGFDDINPPNAATWLSFGLIVLFMIMSAFIGPKWIVPLGQDNATKLASTVRLETDAEIKKASEQGNNLSVDGATSNVKKDASVYPDTSQEHIPVVTLSAAREKAERMMSGDLGTRYDIREGEIQVMAGKLVYIFDLRPDGFFNSRRVDGKVGQYITVSAEDPSAGAQLSQPYDIKYYPGGLFGHNLERLIWSRYKTFFVDGLSAEVDDDGNLFYTASLNKSVVRWERSIPVMAFTVNAVTGEVKEYNLPGATGLAATYKAKDGELPPWVDRVFAADTAKSMMDRYGHWGAGKDKAPYKWGGFGESGVSRTKVAGEPNLVFTNEGPAWQFLMAPRKADLSQRKSATEIVLMDTRSGAVRHYPADGVQIEDAIEEHFKKKQNNTAQLVPDQAGVYKVNGRLVWVGGLVPADKLDSTDPISFNGVGMLDAKSGNSAGAIIGTTKGDALGQLASWYSNNNQNATPSADAKPLSVKGVVLSNQMYVDGGKTRVVIRLVGDTNVYSGSVTNADRATLERLIAKVGDEVVIGYTDDGSKYREINSLSIIKEAAKAAA